MRIGIPREIMTREHRVSATAGAVAELVRAGHDVMVETDAGRGSGISNDEYARAGAQLTADISALWDRAELILKVKEPVGPELERLREEQILFTYLHAAASRTLTNALVASRCTAFAYETVELPSGALPLLAPMSEMAGRLAAQEAAHALLKNNGGRGVLMGGVPGTAPADVLIIGAGSAGLNAAMMAVGLHANVTVVDRDPERLREVDRLFAGRATTRAANQRDLLDLAQHSDVVIGAVLVHGAKAARLLTATDVATMREGAVLVDIAIDQGGCFEPSRPTTHDDPTFTANGCVFYCVKNMPGAVPLTATSALSNATLPYVLHLADRGWLAASREDRSLALGLNVHDGQIVYPAVAEAFGLSHRALTDILSS